MGKLRKVYLQYPFESPIDIYFQSILENNIEIIKGPIIPCPADFEILVAGRPKRVHLEASPNLDLVVIPWAGIPEETRVLLIEPKYSRLQVHNLHHNAMMVAEVALALLLAAAKYVIPFDKSLRKHDWSLRYYHRTSIQLAGKTVVILGYGEIGQRLGKMLAAMDMDVLGVRRDTTKPVMKGAPNLVYGLEAIGDLLPKAQVLIVALPLTDETDNLLDQETLALLPEGAILVNVGRGGLVDQKALYEALKSGRLGGAGIDVWYHYPRDTGNRLHTPPADYPFHELENVVLSPHRAGLSDETEIERAIELSILLNAAARGEPIPNKVDLEAGY